MSKPDESIFGMAEMIYRQCQERGIDKPHVLPGSSLCSPLPVPVTLKLLPIDPLHFSPVLLPAYSLSASPGKKSAADELHMWSSQIHLLLLPLLQVHVYFILWVWTQSEARPPLTDNKSFHL